VGWKTAYADSPTADAAPMKKPSPLYGDARVTRKKRKGVVRCQAHFQLSRRQHLRRYVPRSRCCCGGAARAAQLSFKPTPRRAGRQAPERAERGDKISGRITIPTQCGSLIHDRGVNAIHALVSGMVIRPRSCRLFQRVQELVFLHGLGGGLEGQLRRSGLRHHKQQRERGT